MENINENPFYTALKNSQPIAFLASLSIIIAAFTYTNQLPIEIKNYAVIASFMFLFSFIAALTQQIVGKKYSGVNLFSTFGVYFFFAIGVFQFLLIAMEFSKSLFQIPIYFLGWLFFTMGGSIGIPSLIKIHKSIVKREGLIEIFSWIGALLVSSPFLIISFFILYRAFYEFDAQGNYDWIGYTIGIPAVIGFLMIGIFEYLKKYSRRKNS